MSRRVEGKVAFVTGAARGQGRAHALRLAEEGASIIMVDICSDIDGIDYPLGTEADLHETVRMVEDRGQKAIASPADIRDLAAMQRAVNEGVEAFGRLDIVVANAGVASFGSGWELDEAAWSDMLDINLTGAWKTAKAAIPTMINQGTGGSIIFTSSIAGLTAFLNMAHYVASKHGVVGLMRTLAAELAPHNIRVNTVNPTTVDTGMVRNETTYKMFLGDGGGSDEEVNKAMTTLNGLNVPAVDPRDIANAVLWLASDEARYVTGTTNVVDAGALAPFKIPHD